MGQERLAPNSALQFDGVIPSAQYIVTTEQHEITLEIRRNGPYAEGYFIAFVAAQPPITEATFFPGEIYVKDDEVIAGEVFVLSALLPLISQSAFRAIEITAVAESAGQEGLIPSK